MVAWIAENLASIVLLLVVAAIVFFLIRSKIRERKQGACVCGALLLACVVYHIAALFL